MKKCNKCGETKPLDDFQKRASNKDGHTGMCKQCKREYDNAHYKANPQRAVYIRDNSAKRIEVNRVWVLEYLQEHGCVDCNESNPVVLQFDHRGDKIGNVADLVYSHSLHTVQKEVVKCDVRCANCHIKKTARDFGFWKIARVA